jgi:hypothetical protein
MPIDREEIERQIKTELDNLERRSASSTDPCLVRKVIAVRDSAVRTRMIEKIAAGNEFRGIRCLPRDSVLFAFDCPPNTICLIPPTFLVIVDTTAQRVREIVDPFDPAEFLESGNKLETANVSPSPVVKEVEATITGGFLFASIKVDEQPILLSAISGGRKGKGTVTLAGAFVDVKLTITGDHASFKMTIKINGKEQSRTGFVQGGVEILYQFPMSDFGL